MSDDHELNCFHCGSAINEKGKPLHSYTQDDLAHAHAEGVEQGRREQMHDIEMLMCNYESATSQRGGKQDIVSVIHWLKDKTIHLGQEPADG